MKCGSGRSRSTKVLQAKLLLHTGSREREVLGKPGVAAQCGGGSA